MADPKLIATLSTLLGALPGVKEKQFPNHTSFFTGKNIFVFTSRTSNRVILKLPKERIAALLQREDITLGAVSTLTLSSALRASSMWRGWRLYCLASSSSLGSLASSS